MKQKINREAVLFILIIPVFLFAAITISKYSDSQGKSYTISGKGSAGYSVIYETLSKVGFDVDSGSEELKGAETADIQVVVESSNTVRNDENIKEWVRSGGNLLLLTTSNNYIMPYGGLKIKKNNEILVYGFDKGTVVTANAYSFTNKSLLEDTTPAYTIIETLSIMGYKKLFFNEYYTYSKGEKVSLWRDIPYGVKLGLYQCLLILLLLVLYKGRRFGKIVPYYEEVERVENEYVFSAASLFKKAGCYDVVVESYFNTLLYEMKKELKLYGEVTREDFLELWERGNLPELDRAREIDSIMKKTQGEISRREYMKAISNFDILTETLRKRSELYWKQLQIRG